MGKSGAILITTMLFMAVTSAGSAELVAVSSLFTYDIYRTYINPKATGALTQPAMSAQCSHADAYSPPRTAQLIEHHRNPVH